MLYAIGDVHGCADELRQLLTRLAPTPDDTVVFLGDYIDRGPRSRDVVDQVLELAQRTTVIALAGNHEDMLRAYLADPEASPSASFILNGGSATLASYADAAGEVRIPAAHRAFFDGLGVVHETERHVFVHAGLPEVPLAELDPVRDRRAMLWMRGRFLTTDYDWGKVIVHGHTWVPHPTIRPNRINVDTGCVFDHRLTAVALPEVRLTSVRRVGAPRRIVLPDPGARRAARRFVGAVPVWIRRGDHVIELVTVDYSELGLYLRCQASAEREPLTVGERVEGVIGADPATRVAFGGVIVRRRDDGGGAHYGVRLDSLRAAAD